MTTNNSVAGLDLASALQRALSARQQTLAAALPAGVGQASWYRDSLTQTLARKASQDQVQGGATTVGDNRRFKATASDPTRSTARGLATETRKASRDEGASWIEQRKSRTEATARGGASSDAPSKTDRWGTAGSLDRAGAAARGGDSSQGNSEAVSADAISAQSGEVETKIDQPIDEPHSSLFPTAPTTGSVPAGLREFLQTPNSGEAKPHISLHRSLREGASTPPAGLLQSLGAQSASGTTAANQLHPASPVHQALVNADGSAPVDVLDEAIPTDDMADVISVLGTSGVANGVAAIQPEEAMSAVQLSSPQEGESIGNNDEGLNVNVISLSKPGAGVATDEPAGEQSTNGSHFAQISSALTDPKSATDSTADSAFTGAANDDAANTSEVAVDEPLQTVFNKTGSAAKAVRAQGAARDIAGRILEKQSNSVTTAGETLEQTSQNGRVGTGAFAPSIPQTSNASPWPASLGTGTPVGEAAPVSPAAVAVTGTAVVADAGVEAAGKAELSPASGGSRTATSDVSASMSSGVSRGGVSSTATPADEASAAIRMGHAHETTERLSHAVRSAQTAGQPLRFRLHPPELGVLQVEVAFRDGRVTARLDVETEAGRQAVADSLPALREALVASGANIERLDVRIHSTPREESQAGEDQSNRGDQHADSGNSEGQQKGRDHSRDHDNSPEGGRRDDRSQRGTTRAVRMPPASGNPAQVPSEFDQLDIQI